MPYSLITHLRHVDIAVPDYDEQVTFYRDHWGLTLTGNETGLSYFAAEGSPERYIVRVREADEKRVDLISFGAASRTDVDALAAKLATEDVRIIHEPTQLQSPGGGYGFRFFDLEGRVIEVSAEVATRQHRKIEVREDIPVRLSHVVVNSPQPEVVLAWYERHLGFRLSDTNIHPQVGVLFYFLRCSPQHHSLAVSRGPHPSLNHISFEMRGIDEYMYGSGRMMRNGWEKIWGPGRHRAGDNTFTYFIDPNGNTMEYTTELLTLDEDAWHPSIFDVTEPATADQWGTANPMNEFVAPRMFNDPDKGLFVPPPI